MATPQEHSPEFVAERLAAIIESSDDAIISKDLDGTIRTWNSAAERIFGYTPAEMIGESVFRLIPPNLHDEERGILARLQAGERVDHYETTRLRKDGKTVSISLAASPLRDRAGNLIGASAIKRDLGAQRALEAQLRQAQKMEAVGRLAGGIAHDFNNLLSVVIGYTEMLLADVPPSDAIRPTLAEIMSAGQRAAELTRKLLAFSRQQVLALRVLNVNDVLKGITPMLHRTIGEDIELVLILSPDPCRCKADPGQLEQVLMNLVVNARDAMVDGGHLTIETANVHLDELYVREHMGSMSGPHVMIAVTDTGCGMDLATQAQVFEPFFTTKPEGRGTGLGLSTVYGIIKQVGGNIWLYSEQGKGTTFKIYLPLALTLEDAPVVAQPVIAPRGGTETILLVEDDAQVRALAYGILTRARYTVLEAANGGEAMLINERHRGRIDLLLTDVVMPWMSGRELSEMLVSQRPGLRVLHMSGYAENAVVRHGILDSGINYLQKPITPTSLLVRVREVLDA